MRYRVPADRIRGSKSGEQLEGRGVVGVEWFRVEIQLVVVGARGGGSGVRIGFVAGGCVWLGEVFTAVSAEVGGVVFHFAAIDAVIASWAGSHGSINIITCPYL